MKNKEKKTDISSAVEKFGLIPEYQLKKKEKKILEFVAGEEPVDFFDLCVLMDIKPSKLQEKTDKLIANGFLGYAEDGKTFVLPPVAAQLLVSSKDDLKRENKFKEFLRSLNEEELKEFYILCDCFSYTEECEVSETAEETAEEAEKAE